MSPEDLNGHGDGVHIRLVGEDKCIYLIIGMWLDDKLRQNCKVILLLLEKTQSRCKKISFWTLELSNFSFFIFHFVAISNDSKSMQNGPWWSWIMNPLQPHVFQVDMDCYFIWKSNWNVTGLMSCIKILEGLIYF